MKLAYHCWTSMNSDLVTDIKATAAAGYTGLELGFKKIDKFLSDGHTIQDLAALLREHKVEPVTINALEFIAFRGEEYGQIKARCREMAGWCQAIGCPTLIVVPSPTPDWQISWDAVREEYVKVLRELDDIARPLGVKLAFEFLGFGWSTVRTPRAAMEIVQAAGRDNLGVVLDCMHFYAGGGLFSEIAALDPSRILAFHIDDIENVPKEEITDALRLLPGLGVIPLGEICRNLAATGYDGACSIELFRPEYYDWDPYELAKQARELATRELSPYFKVS